MHSSRFSYYVLLPRGTIITINFRTPTGIRERLGAPGSNFATPEFI